MGVDTDLPLIDAVVAGDENALELLMLRHQEPLYAFVFRYLGDERATREIVHETFVRVFRKAATFQPRSTVKTWIFTIALNQCRDLARAPRMRSLDQAGGDARTSRAMTDSGLDTAEEVARRDMLPHLHAAIARLPEKLKTPLVLCALEGWPHVEVARVLGTTPKSVELRVYRAKKRLCEFMSAFIAGTA